MVLIEIPLIVEPTSSSENHYELMALATILARVPQLTDRWTDFNESDLGVVLLELFCGAGDMLAYYLDAQAAEAFLPAARQRQNVINLCKLIGYRLDTPVAATTIVRFSLPSALGSDLTIPAGTVCKAGLDDGDVEFETVEDAVIPHGQLSAEVGVRQGTRRTEELPATGERSQRYALNSTTVAQGSVRVRVGSVFWQETAFFSDSGPDLQCFQVETDGLDVTWIVFGDGVHGAIPPAGETITVEYLETLGSQGNIGASRMPKPSDSAGKTLPSAEKKRANLLDAKATKYAAKAKERKESHRLACEAALSDPIDLETGEAQLARVHELDQQLHVIFSGIVDSLRDPNPLIRSRAAKHLGTISRNAALPEWGLFQRFGVVGKLKRCAAREKDAATRREMRGAAT